MPPKDVTPFNIAGIRFLEIESISVNEWHPLPDGQGRPEQVHLWITLRGVTEPLVVRFKSRRPADELIVALMTHARNVWSSPNDPVSAHHRPGEPDAFYDNMPVEKP